MTHFYGWWIVVACMIVNMFGNALGLFGLGVYLIALSETRGWPLGQISAGATLFLLVSAALMLPVGKIIGRFGPKPIVVLGAISMAAGLLGIGLSQRLVEAYAAFAVMGIGWASLSAAAIAAMLAPWFEKYQGRAVSLASLGASIGGITGVPVLLFSIAQIGLTSTTIVAAVTIVGILLPIAGLVLKRSPSEMGLFPDGAPAPSAMKQQSKAWTVGAAARTPALWTVTAAFGIAMFVQVGFLTHQVAFLSSVLPPALVATTASATAIAALIGRMGLARYVDDVDQRVLSAIVLVLAATMLGLLALSPTTWTVIAACVIFGLTVGNVSILSAIIVRREFGAISFGAIFGFASSIIQFTTALGPSFYGVLREVSLSYRWPLLIAAALDIVAAIIVLGGRFRRSSGQPSYPLSARR
ncbi:MFS transporter [Bradyrhizobium sp. LHD-71]|uniref:MFS transporter n=1 Tax=Bradyrhizobium sp. LHD-71 TaxID=3072141 RepID=UPI00280D0935|nr:MFS transporter [Bradyrhizobium sp. LHD-71]MDQ8727300.1 MFS transporter [Bradyrhizobium sp. LHD-71]